MKRSIRREPVVPWLEPPAIPEPALPADALLLRRAKGVGRATTAGGAAIALASISGWLFELPALIAVHPHVVGMGLLTAICLLMAAAGTWLGQGACPPRTGWLGAILGLIVMIIACFKALDGHWLPGLREVLGARLGPGEIYPTAMSDYAALALLLIGLALVLSARRGGRREAAAQILAMASVGIASFVLIGYVYDVQAIVRGTADFPMALNTAVAVGLVGTGLALGRPAVGPARILVLDSPGGSLLRGLLPAFFVLPFALGWLRLQGERAGLYDAWFGVALMTALLAASVIGLTWWSSLALDRKELERVRADEERRRREEAYRALAEHSPDIVSRFDIDRRRLYVNPAIERYTGIPAAAFIGRTFEEQGYAAEHAGTWNRLMDGVFRDGTTQAAMFDVQGPDGLRRIFESRLVAERGPDGEVASVLAVSRDITELRRAYDKLAEAERHKDEFLAVASHELRTPLNTVLGYVSFLQEGVGGSLSAEQQDFADRAMAGVERLDKLVEDVVEYARIASGRLPLDRVPTDYDEFVSQVASEFRPFAEAMGVTLEVDVHVDEAACLDGSRIAQVLRKLLDNALKFTPAGGRVVVQGRWRDGVLLTEVSDTGLGVDGEGRERIFAPFWQGDMSSTRSAGGLGLGLAISRGIVEAHGGSIGVDSRPGAGSTFWFAFPAYSQPEERGDAAERARTA